MADEKIRVGIIGANAGRGWGSGAHIPAILALPVPRQAFLPV